MASALRSYMDDEITAFQFDDVLTQIQEATEDETVMSVGSTLWYYYDDCKDHKIVASKDVWDLFNRLLLLLESDGQIEVIKTARRWQPRQAVAAATLAIFCEFALRVGFGEHLLIFAMPFGLVSIALAWWASRTEKNRVAAEALLGPFPSVASLLHIRRGVFEFRKRRYPHSIAGRRIRSGFVVPFMQLPFYLSWLMFAPLPLFFQMLPTRDCETVIRMPEQAAGCHRHEDPTLA